MIAFSNRFGYIVILLLLGGCAGQPPLPSEPSTADVISPTRHRILQTAENLLGVPYRWGGNTLKGMDCSGLVHYIYDQVGIPVPRTTRELYRNGRPANRPRPGDLVFFDIDGDGVSHVGIYTGNGQMIHASSGRRRVRKVTIDSPYWRKRMAGSATFLACTTC